MYRRFVTLGFGLLAIGLSGCGFWASEESFEPVEDSPRIENAQKRPGSPVRMQRLQTPPRTTDVELLWEIPSDPVDGFVIYYGQNPLRLKNSVKVDVDNLGRFEDRKHGFVFRYILKNVPADKNLMVSIAAFRGDDVSPPSEVFTVQP